jgi:hypothetical protein
MTGDTRLLESNAMTSGKYLVTFQRTLFPPSSVCDLLTLLDETLCSFDILGYVTLATISITSEKMRILNFSAVTNLKPHANSLSEAEGKPIPVTE